MFDPRAPQIYEDTRDIFVKTFGFTPEPGSPADYLVHSMAGVVAATIYASEAAMIMWPTGDPTHGSINDPAHRS